VGVGADNKADPPIDERAQGLLFAGRLGMEIDDDGIGRVPQGAGNQLLLDSPERAVHLRHVDPAQRVHDKYLCPIARFIKPRAPARRSRRKIDRPDQPVLALDIDERFLLVEGVVAERHRIGPRIEKLHVDLLGDAEPAGRILAVDDDEIELPAHSQPGQRLKNCAPARAADDIAEK